MVNLIPNPAVNWTASTLRVPAASYFLRWKKMAKYPNKLKVAICGFIVALPCIACEDNPVETVKKGQPPDVVMFLNRVSACGRIAWESSLNAQRKRDLETSSKSLKCESLAKEESDFRKRFSNQPQTINALDVVKVFSH